jgi:tRNA (guanine-N(7)-)-methyltransferase subunit TRM82
MSYYHPFQKLCYISQSGGDGLLLAAAGPQILSLDLTNGGILSRWPDDAPRSDEKPSYERSTNGEMLGRSVDDDPPTKRRKTSPSQEEDQDSRESSISVEFVSERAKGQRRKKKKVVKSPPPNVSHILSTGDGRHVVAVTAEDKCVRVFELVAAGFLKLLSERQGSYVSLDMGCAYYCVDVCQKDFVL